MKFLIKFFLSLLVVSFSSCSTNPIIHFVLPEGFTGEVTVVYGQPCANLQTELNATLITLNIPESGVLITQLPHNCDIANRKYFYKSASGQLTEIPKLTGLEESRNWTATNNTQDPERTRLGAYAEACGFKTDNGYDSESATIMAYDSFLDSLESPYYAMRNFMVLKRELKKCQDSKP